VAAVGFYLLSALAIAGAVLVIFQPHVIYSALFLIGTLLALAGLFLLLHAQFIAIVHIIVYAGAIMVLFLFVIMLLGLGLDPVRLEQLRLQRTLGLGLGLIFLVQIGWVALGTWVGVRGPSPPPSFGYAEELGRLLFTTYLFPFEATSILLFVAAIGAVVLGKRSRGEK
jgi:NADH-quinone oxidoreductase subunit J